MFDHPHYTDPKLAADLLGLVPMAADDTYLDPCCGLNKVFFDHSICHEKYWCEIELGRDFYDWRTPVDWIVTNPEYTKLWKLHCHAMWLAKKGIGWLLSREAISVFGPGRLSEAEQRGWTISKCHVVETRWPRCFYFLLFERGNPKFSFSWSCERYD